MIINFYIDYLPIKIKEVVENINKTYFLPHIQRELVWKPAQIYRLFDSLMREYPISTFLFWKIKDPGSITKVEFIKNYLKQSIKVENTDKNRDNYWLILDGQQRLQSFYISLCGTYEKKELFLN